MNTIYLHPMIVHFPIALLMIGALSALVSKFFGNKEFASKLYQFAAFSVIIGAAAACAAILSGYLFTGEMVGVMGEIRSTHILYAFASLTSGALTALLMAISLWSKSKKTELVKNLALLTSLITAVMVGITGHYGGIMVFM